MPAQGVCWPQSRELGVSREQQGTGTDGKGEERELGWGADRVAPSSKLSSISILFLLVIKVHLPLHPPLLSSHGS